MGLSNATHRTVDRGVCSNEIKLMNTGKANAKRSSSLCLSGMCSGLAYTCGKLIDFLV